MEKINQYFKDDEDNSFIQLGVLLEEYINPVGARGHSDEMTFSLDTMRDAEHLTPTRYVLVPHIHPTPCFRTHTQTPHTHTQGAKTIVQLFVSETT